MNYFNKKNLVIFSIAILLIVNIATISTVIFLTYKKPVVPESRSHRESFRKARRGLNLSLEQKNAFEMCNKEYKGKAKEIFTQLHKKRVMMMDEFSKAEADSMVLYQLAKEIGVLHEKLKLVTIDHLLDLKAVCTEDQFKHLEGMFRSRIMEDKSRNYQFRGKERDERPSGGRDLKRWH